MSRTTTGSDRAVSGQVDVFAAPLIASQRPGTVPGVIMCHGYNHLGTDITNSAVFGEYGIYDALRQRYCVGVGHFDGDAFGNDAAIADVLAMDTWMTTMGASSTKRALIGASMGVLTALNFARAHPDRVSCVACFIPQVDPREAFGTSAINAAYPPAYNDTTHGPTHNPIDYASTFPNIPVHLWYSTADTAALPAPVVAFAAACPTATATVCSTTLDHSEGAIAAAPLSDVLAFIASHLS